MFRDIIRDLSLYRDWKKKLNGKGVKNTLLEEYNTKVDGADRLHIVVNIPTDQIDEEYGLVKSDIDRLSVPFIKNQVKDVSTYLNSLGLQEMYDYYEPISKLDKYSYLVIVGFKPFDSVLYNTVVYRRIIPLLVLLGIIYTGFLYFS